MCKVPVPDLTYSHEYCLTRFNTDLHLEFHSVFIQPLTVFYSSFCLAGQASFLQTGTHSGLRSNGLTWAGCAEFWPVGALRELQTNHSRRSWRMQHAIFVSCLSWTDLSLSSFWFVSVEHCREESGFCHFTIPWHLKTHLHILE